MAQEAFLVLAGEKSAEIKGTALQKTRENQITVVAFEHKVAAERIAAGGLLEKGKPGTPSPKRRHHSIVVTKEFDHASPLLHKAHTANEGFKTWELHCWHTPPAGGGPRGVREENHYTIRLSGARIASLRTVMPNARKQENFSVPEYEEVEFTYDQIAWNWLGKGGPGNSIYTDEEVDFSEDKPSWVDTLEARMKAKMADIGKSAATAAKEAIAQAFAKGGGEGQNK